MNESPYFDILVDWNYWGNFQTELKKRELYLKRIHTLFSPRTALAMLGIRRAGKSSIIHLYLQELFSNKSLEIKNSLIINQEDPRFTKQLTAQDLHQLFEVYLQNLDPTDPIIILDEVHKLEQLANILITNIATLQSYNRLKTQIGVSLDTVERFVRYFEIARMFFFIKKCP